MSFAELEGKYPAGLELKEIVERRRGKKTEFQRMPPVVVLASLFAEEGVDEVREIMSFLTKSGLGIDPERDFFPQIPTEFQGPMKLNHALIIFGITVASIHKMLVSGEFDASLWCDRYNGAITGTLLPELRVKGEPGDGVSAEELAILRQRAFYDKTLSFFFETPSLMPNMLRKTLDNLNVFPIAQSLILPLYKERAQILLSPQV